jgi:ArsR family transcriptional regulator
MDKQTQVDVFNRLRALSDVNRSRILTLLRRNELTVSELCSVLQLPQSTVSRHLKVLLDAGWVASRADGTSRHYRIATSLDPPTAELWRIVGDQVAGLEVVAEDRERAREALRRRRERSRAFFSAAAQKWDDLRGQMFGRSAECSPLVALLDPIWTVGDLGTGTGLFAAQVAPFVREVIAVDDSAQMLAAARKRLKEFENVEVRQGPLEALPVEDVSLDVAVLQLVLHYVPDPPQVLSEVSRTLRRDGRIVIVDMRQHQRSEYQAEMGHVWLGFAEDTLATWLAEAGFERGTHHLLPPDPDAKGPPLFAASARKSA